MKIHLACSGMMCQTYGKYLIPRFIEPEPKIAELRSYFEVRDFTGHDLPVFGRPFMMDSGAFSAYSQKCPISVEEYAEFIIKHESKLDCYINLDAIPADQSDDAIKKAVDETFENQQYMEKRGLKPIPVFHSGEPWDALKHYVDNYERLALGGMVKSSDQGPYLETAWNTYLTDKEGKATRKVHGFGMTTLSRLVKYPWDTVDSTTWLTQAKIGIVHVPPKKSDGTFNYLVRPTLVSISENCMKREEIGGHYDSMTPAQQEGVREYLAQWGLEPEEVRGHPVQRFIANINYWIKVEEALNDREHNALKAKQFELF